MKKVFKETFQIFHDAPGRKEDFLTITGSNEFPLNIWSTKLAWNFARARGDNPLDLKGSVYAPRPPHPPQKKKLVYEATAPHRAMKFYWELDGNISV